MNEKQPGKLRRSSASGAALSHKANSMVVAQSVTSRASCVSPATTLQERPPKLLYMREFALGFCAPYINAYAVNLQDVLCPIQRMWLGNQHCCKFACTAVELIRCISSIVLLLEAPSIGE